MKICPYDKCPEKYVWRCRNRYQPRPKAAFIQCDTMRSIRDRTFFGKTENFGGGSNSSMFQVRRTNSFRRKYYHSDVGIHTYVVSWVQIGQHRTRVGN